jgi:hypothetical protein
MALMDLPTVTQQAEQIPTEGPSLCDMAEARFERLEPCAQPIQPRRRIARQHRTAAYRKWLPTDEHKEKIEYISDRDPSRNLTK